MRIAFLVTYGIGNAVMKTPAIKALRSLYPDATIDVIVEDSASSQGGYDVMEGWKDIDGLYRNISTHDYDIIIGGVPFVPSRLGVASYKRDAGVPDGWDNPHSPPDNKWLKHEVEYKMDLVRRLGYEGKTPPLHVEVQKTSAKKARFLKANKKNVVLSIGYKHEGEWWRKHWGNEKFAETADILHKRGWNVIMVGGEADSDNADEIMTATKAPIMDLVGRLSLQDTIGIMSMCKVHIGNDTGCAHIAAALDIYTVVVYGFNVKYIDKVRPWCKIYSCVYKKGMDCQPCEEQMTCETVDCMKQLDPEEVLKVTLMGDWR